MAMDASARVAHDFRIASFGLRCGAYVLDVVLAVLTLGIVWFAWLLLVAGRGQSPGKQLLGLRVLRSDGSQAGWGLTVMREVGLKSLLPYVLLLFGGAAGGGIALLCLAAVLFLFAGSTLSVVRDARNRAWWDKSADTLVACRDESPEVLPSDP